MPYRRHVRNGAVVLDEAVVLPEGARVTVMVLEDNLESPTNTLYERIAPFVGKARNLPPDAAQNHDHYLHGQPRR